MYQRNEPWADEEVGNTPIIAAKLNHMEQGIADAAAVADAALNRLDTGVGTGGGTGGGGGWVIGVTVDPTLYPDGTAIAEIPPGLFN